MSSDVIIRVENLGKRYSLSHLRDQRYVALRDVITDKAKNLFRRNSLRDIDSSLRAVGSAPEAEPEADLCLPPEARRRRDI
jgi:hypothetical protein